MNRLEQTLNKPVVVLVVGMVAVALNVLLYFGIFVPRMTPLIANIHSLGTSLPEAILPESSNKSDSEVSGKSDSGASGGSDSEAGSKSDSEAGSKSDSEASGKSVLEASSESDSEASSESVPEASLESETGSPAASRSGSPPVSQPQQQSSPSSAPVSPSELQY